MTNLSLSAQAVLDATDEWASYDIPTGLIAAAALRAAADQLGEDLEFYNERVVSVSDLLAIANELEGITYGTYRCNLEAQ